MQRRPALAIAVILVLLILPLPNQVLADDPAPQATSDTPVGVASDQKKGIELLSQRPGSQVAYHVETGKLRFLGTDLEHPIPQPAPLPAGATPEEAARQFLATYGELFGLKDQSQDLQVMQARDADGGRAVVRFQQVIAGVPVMGGELIVQLNAEKAVLSVNGEVLPETESLGEPGISAEAAAATGLAAVVKDTGQPAEALQVTQPELWYYNPRLLGGPGPQITSLVWRMEVQAIELLPIKELVLVDAQRGVVILQFSEIDAAMYRKVYDNANNRSAGLPGTGPVRVEGQGPSGVADVNSAYDYAGDVYNFYLNTHGRDSLDGHGMQLIATVRYCDPDPTSACPYDNAFWNGQQMVYGQGYASADDVVAHEMTHAVTDHESRLFYYMQSGAINESFSDIWGEFIDLVNGRGNDGPSVRWLLGEDLPIGAIRSMSNPPAYGDPDRIGSSNYWCNASDNGGVHVNSGVSNKAAFLITDGGSFNGKTVTGLGITKAAKIYYETQANLLTSAGDFADLYNALQQACNMLVGTSGITASDCQQVKNAVDAVQMNIQPTSCAATEAPICPAGQTPDHLFFDNLETPSSGYWASSALAGSNLWYYPQNPNPYQQYGWDPTYATSGVINFWGDDPEQRTDAVIRMTSGVTVPTGQTVYMHFKHAYAFEGSTFDGGVVEYSTNGTPWLDTASFFTENGYRGTISSSYGNPLAGRQAFVGRSSGYYSSRLRLNSLAGQNVRFRFRIGTDTSGGALGWWIDDIRIYTCGSSVLPKKTYLPMIMRYWPPKPATPQLNAINNPPGSRNYTVTWTAANLATEYTLAESFNSANIGDSSQVYNGSATSWSASNKPDGTYWVRATNSWGTSSWSNMQCTNVQPAPQNPIQNGNFERGPVDWQEYSSHGWDIIMHANNIPVSPRSGSWVAWLGGEYNDISYIQQTVTVPPGMAYLAYWHWIASSDYCGYDYGGVVINGSTVADVYTLCSSVNTGGWVKHVVNLNAYAGQTIQLQIRVETDGSLNSNLFVDDVAFQSSSTAAGEALAPVSFEGWQTPKSAREGLSAKGVTQGTSERLLGQPLGTDK